MQSRYKNGNCILCSYHFVVKIKDVVLEKRKLERQIGEGQDMIEVIVVIPESGLPLAVIPTTADEYRTWKEVIKAI